MYFRIFQSLGHFARVYPSPDQFVKITRRQRNAAVDELVARKVVPPSVLRLGIDEELVSGYVPPSLEIPSGLWPSSLGACTELNPVYRRLVKRALEELQLIEQQIGQLDQEMSNLLRRHQDAVERLAEVPGLGVDSAQQIIAEVGA